MSYLRFQVVVFGLTFVAATFLVGVDGVCDKAEFQKCTAIMSDYQESTFTREEVEASCRIFDEFLNCANRTGCVSSKEEKAVVKGLKQTIDYLCDQRIEEYVDASQCLASQKLRTISGFCKDVVKWQPDKTPCEDGCLFVSCVVQTLQKCCGKKAGGLIDDFLKAFTASGIPNDCQFRTDLVVEVLPSCTIGDSNSMI